MSQLKNRALKLEKQTAWLWFEKILELDKDRDFKDWRVNTSIVHSYIMLGILKKPAPHIWRRFELMQQEADTWKEQRMEELEAEAGECDPETEKRSHLEISAFVTVFSFALWQDAPCECRAVDGERVLLERARGWVSEVRPDAEKWPLDVLKQMIEEAVKVCPSQSGNSPANCGRFMQEWKA